MLSEFNQLYIAYAVSCIGDRLWTFALTLILEHIGGIRLVCFGQLIEEIIIMLFSSVFGNWLDRNTRKHGMLTVLAINNLNVMISAASLAACVYIKEGQKDYQDQWSRTHIGYFLFIILSIVSCSISCLASEMQKIAFTKDWIVVMARREDRAISGANAIMKSVDLSSSIVSPFAAGFIIDKIGHTFACFIFIAYNMLSWIVEGLVLCRIYWSIYELQIREPMKAAENEREIEYELISNKRDPSFSRKICRKFANIQRLFKIYYSQSIWSASFGLTLLYMTVLGFDGIAIGYGKSQGLSATSLGVFRSIGSAIGVFGAIMYAVFEKLIGVRKTGLVGFTWQQISLYLCIVSIWLPGSPYAPFEYFRETTATIWWEQFKESFIFTTVYNTTDDVDEVNWSTWTVNGQSIISVVALLMGIAIARFGLYMGELSVTQIMQESIPEKQRGTVFGVQDSIAQFFSVIKDILVIVLPDPKTFGLLIILSVIFVTIGYFYYDYYLCKSQTKEGPEANNQKNPDEEPLRR